MRRRASQPFTEPWPASPLKITLPEEFASSPNKDSGTAAALARGAMPPSASFVTIPASPLRFSPSSSSPSLTKHPSPDRWLNHDLSSSPCLSPNRSKTSNSLRDSWFDVEWRPPPGFEGLAPASRLPDLSPSGARFRAIPTSSTAPALHVDTGLQQQFRQPDFPKDSQSRIIKTPPPPSRVALAVAKRFFLIRHTKDCIDAFSRWRRHALLNALHRRQSDDAVREWRRRNSRRMLILLKQGVVASQMDRLAAGKRLERACARSLTRAAWSAMTAYSFANKLGLKLSRRISKMRCTNAVHLLVRFQRLRSAVERIRDKTAGNYQHRFFSLFRRIIEISSVLVHRADCFHQTVVSRSLMILLRQWKGLSHFASRIEASFHAALRRWMLLAAAKTFSAWQSLTLIACSNRATAIKWRMSSDRRRLLAAWAEITRLHKCIKIATARMWMQNDSRTVSLFFAAWKSIAKASLTALEKFNLKWRLRSFSAAFDRWCAAAGSLTALRLFVNGCHRNLRRVTFLDWCSALSDANRKLHRAARASLHFLQKKCAKLWRGAASFKAKGRAILCDIFATGWCSHLLRHFFSTFRSRVCDVKIQARISYYRGIVFQTAVLAWKTFVFGETQAAGSCSPVQALRQSTAKRLWAHQFPPKSPSKSIRSSHQFIKQARVSGYQAIDFDKISDAVIQFSIKLLHRAFNGWLSLLAELQATRRVHAAAMQWHHSVYIQRLLKHVFGALMTFAARSRTRLTLKSKKCSEHYASNLKHAVVAMWKQASRILRQFHLKMYIVTTKIRSRMMAATLQHWLQWSRCSRVRSGYLLKVVEPCIEDSASKRLLACFRRAFGTWREFLAPRRLSKRFARRCLLKEVGQLLVRWHHVALCSVDERVADAIAVSRRKFSLLRFVFREWLDIADEIKNRPQLAEADMWFSRRLLRRVISSWDQQRLLIRTRFAESSRTKETFRTPASQSRLEAALEREMNVQLHLNHCMQDALINPVVAAPLKALIGEKQTPWRAHVERVVPNVGHRIVPTSSAPVKAVPTNRGKSASGKFSNDTSRALIDPVTVTPPHKVHSQRPISAASTSSAIATPQSLLSSVRLRSPGSSKADDAVDMVHPHGQLPGHTIVPTFALMNTSGSQLIAKYLEQSGWLRAKGDDVLLMWVPHPRDIDFDRVLASKLIVNQLRGSQYLCAPTGLLQIIGSAASESLAMLHSSHPQWLLSAQQLCACAAALPSSSIFYPQSVILSEFMSSARSIPDALGAWILKAAKPSPEFKYVVLDNTSAVIRRTQSQCHPVKASTGVDLLAAASAWRGCSDGSVGPGGAPIMPPDTLVQKYIQQPLLLGGRKFTISCYLLVLSVRPAFVLLNTGFIRRALNKYAASDLSDEFGHSTNLKKMRQHPNFLALRDDCALSISKISPAFKGLKNAPILFDTEILPKIRLALTATLLQSSPQLLQARGSFGFLSANFIIDSNLNPWLLSMDRAPDLEAYNAFQDAFLPPLVQETVGLISCFFTEHARDDAACRCAVRTKMRSYAVLLDEK